MTQTQRLPSIGDRVLVDPRKVRDSIPDNLSIQLINDQVGTVLDYKMTDGQGIGVILELSDGTSSWFFEDEVTRA